MADSQSTVSYRSIHGFPGYLVGDDGSVWHCWINCRWGRRLRNRWKQLKPGVQRKRTAGRAYRYVNLTPIGSHYRTFRVHRLVLAAFVGPCPEGMEARHMDGYPSNNALANLVWGTPADNRADNRKHGRYSETPRNQRYTHDGKTMCLKEWSVELGVNYNTLYSRVRLRHMPFDVAISMPFLGVAGNGNRRPFTQPKQK